MCGVSGSTLTTVAWRVRRLGRVVVSVMSH
jgi:hypothetical protein